MAVVKCPDCGGDVSERANVCIHCGAPLNFSKKNGAIKIKCCNIDGNPYKVKIVDQTSGEVLATIPQRGVVSFDINQDTVVYIKYPMLKTIEYKLPFNGTHYYEIVMGNGFFWPKLQINEVTNIDSD